MPKSSSEGARLNQGKSNATGLPNWRSGASQPHDTGASIPVPGNSLIVYPDLNVLKELITPWDPAGITLISVSDRIKGAQKAYSVLRIWVVSYVTQYRDPETAYQMFKAEWRVFRLTIPLQLRLMVEQVLYDLGMPWKALCSGFGPVRDG